MAAFRPMTGIASRLHHGLGIRGHTSIGVVTILTGVFFGTNGYLVGYYEQTLLSIHGIALADKTAFVGDWFNTNAPQPHMFFDLVTYVGEKLQFLDGIYFLYYLASCTMFALGTALLAHHWLPQRLQWMQHLVNVLATIGPAFSLGTFLTIHMEAVPNMAGACAAYLGLACLITRRWTWLAFMLPVTSVLHLQHGIGLASIVLLAVLFGVVERRLMLIASSVFALIIAGYMVIERGLLSGSSEIAKDVAEVGSTGHFNAEVWGSQVIRGGLFLIALAVLNFVLDSKQTEGRRVTYVFALTGLVPIVGVVSDLWNIEPLQSLSRSFFVYRFSMYLAPFAYWFIVRTTVNWCRSRVVTAIPNLLLGVSALWMITRLPFTWLTAYVHQTELIAVMVLVVIARFSYQLSRIVARSMVSAAGMAAVCLLFVAATEVHRLEWPHLSLSRYDHNVIRTTRIAQKLGSADVVATDPSISWMRLFLRRAIVADCHGTPYGGDAWWEYRRRLRALGVEKPNECTGFNDLTIDRILTLRASVGATKILLTPASAAFDDAKRLLPVRWKALDGSGWTLFEIPRNIAEN